MSVPPAGYGSISVDTSNMSIPKSIQTIAELEKYIKDSKFKLSIESDGTYVMQIREPNPGLRVEGTAFIKGKRLDIRFFTNTNSSVESSQNEVEIQTWNSFVTIPTSLLLEFINSGAFERYM